MKLALRFGTLLTLGLGLTMFAGSSAHAMGAKSMAQMEAMPEATAQYPDLPEFDEHADGEIFAIFAHPDDELTVLTQIHDYQVKNPARVVHWIVVSDGGKGFTLPDACPGMSKIDCRTWEAEKAAACMDLAKPSFMLLPDGGLDKISDLNTRIWAEVDRIRKGPVAAVFTHDPTGLYGHPDHMAVHDAVAPEAARRHIPMITAALPEYFRERITLKGEAALRPRLPVTHKFDMNADERARSACSTRAHKSQRILLWVMMQELDAEDFYDAVPREYFNLESNRESNR